MGSKNGSNVKHKCLSKNEKSWQTKQEKMIKAQNEARSHALNHSSGESSNLLDIRFVCMCLLAYAGFFRISELLSISRSNIVTEGLYHKIFIEVSKTDRYREGSWVYIAKTGNFTCPYTYLIKYLEAARIPSFSQNFIIFQILTVRQEFEGQCLVFKAPHC